MIAACQNASLEVQQVPHYNNDWQTEVRTLTGVNYFTHLKRLHMEKVGSK